MTDHEIAIEALDTLNELADSFAITLDLVAGYEHALQTSMKLVEALDGEPLEVHGDADQLLLDGQQLLHSTRRAHERLQRELA